MKDYRLITSIYELNDIKKVAHAGITTVIVGTPFFSVRSTCHFDDEQLLNAKELCRENELELYVLVNRFFVEKELIKLREQLQKLKSLDVDGIYFTDMAVYYEARNLEMEDMLIYNPDTILTDSEDIKAYLELGIKSCTIAKEITLDEMVRIGRKVKEELEVFVHGRLNMMHSKRNLLTNYMQFLDRDIDLRNRYDLYLMEETREEHMPIVEDETGTHVFTGFTLCTFEEIDCLFNSGIRNFRIEALFNDIDYVCKTAADYCDVLADKKDGRTLFHQYQQEYPEQNITKGFLYKKTGLTK